MRRSVRIVWAAVFLILATGFSVCQAADQQLPEDWAQQCVDVKELDFGMLVGRLDPIRRIRITNRWKAPLHVANISLSWGPCHIKNMSEDAIQPGKATELEVTIDTVRHVGQKHQMLRIWFDSPDIAEVQIPVKCYIRRDLVFDTDSDPYCKSIRLDKADKATGTIAHVGVKGWTILGVDGSHPDLDVALREKKREMSKTYPGFEDVEYQIAVSVKPGAKPRKIDVPLTVRISDKNHASFEISVRREVPEPKAPVGTKAR